MRMLYLPLSFVNQKLLYKIEPKKKCNVKAESSGNNMKNMNNNMKNKNNMSFTAICEILDLGVHK